MPRPTKAKKRARLAAKAPRRRPPHATRKEDTVNHDNLESKDDELHFMIGAAAFANDMDAVIEDFFMSHACDSDFLHCILNTFIADALCATPQQPWPIPEG